jgi:hypothetical protein
MTCAVSGSTSPANAPGNISWSRYRSTTFEPSAFAYGTGRTDSLTRLPSFIPASWIRLSPSSGTHPPLSHRAST